MKNLSLLLAVLTLGSFATAAETAKAPAPEKAKAEAKADAKSDDGSCCDDDTKPAEAKTAKTEPKAEAAKKESGATKPAAKSDKK